MKMLKTFGSKRSLLLFSLGIAFILLLTVFWDDETQNYAELSHNLLELKEMDARLDRDVFRITTFLLVQYDPLVQTSNRLRELKEKINNKVKVSDKVLGDLIETYWQGMDEKLDILERIKFQAAIVRNGIHYLPIAAQDLKAVDPNTYQAILELLNSLYTYDLFYTDSLLEDINNTLKQLKKISPSSLVSQHRFPHCAMTGDRLPILSRSKRM
ncbi:MAG: hypothetical protein LC541_04440 [Candidatus Thiodiazotropha sp.]|nr:hypothetical protein [Candidatus Thiodiazotropha sp.]MCM8882566.1 hypothetical protein [Candidatus Thiodiazotropha sp.]MCM8918755.1 hypothetical protein [Candidatus Thiodiazotropha sp.]